MAGIGFELKKLFKKKGLIATFRAYGYAGIICTGPMLLGVLLLLCVKFLATFAGASEEVQELLVSMITYTLLSSLIITGTLSMIVTRFISDMLYMGHKDAILSSFWGSNAILLTTGCLMYGLFLMFSGAAFFDCVLMLWYFAELIVVWNAMSYLTAIKDYRGIFLSFSAAVFVTFLTGALFLWIGVPVIEALLLAVIMGYGVMLCWNVILLHRYFPASHKKNFLFLNWLDQFWRLALSGFLTNLGLFAHLIIMWGSAIGHQVLGLFYDAPYYDVPALLAFMTVLVTTVNFVVSVEVNFYPKYHDYYSLFNDKGSIRDIKQAEKEMLEVLSVELRYTLLKQLFTTLLAISIGSILVTYLPLGFNDLMLGYFRTLCVGYGLYAVGNTVFLILLYFTAYTQALISAAVFSVSVTGFTLISLLFDPVYYGFGFLLGSAVFFFLTIGFLTDFTKRLPYHILSRQPLVDEDKAGLFGRIGGFLDELGEERDR